MFRDETESTSAVYGLTTKARCISAQLGTQDKVRFLVGTHSLKDNEIHLIEVKDDEERTNDIKCLSIFSHASEIWNISPCPRDSSLLFTVYNVITSTGSEFKTSLWKMNELDSTMIELAQLKGHTTDIKCALWNPSEPTSSPKVAVTVEDNLIHYWKLDSGGDPREHATIHPPKTHRFQMAAWNPLHPEQLVSANENGVHGWDLRTSKETFVINQAHTPVVRDIDFNPNKDYYIVTGGDDYRIKFWDYRKPERPLKAIQAHNHWVWNVKYNPYHDQLVLSSGSDGMVNLWNVPSMSSRVTSSGDDDSTGKLSRKDRLIQTFEEHEDSVYSISWATSAWIFASLSYEGRVVVSHVPTEYSDAILLDDTFE